MSMENITMIQTLLCPSPHGCSSQLATNTDSGHSLPLLGRTEKGHKNLSLFLRSEYSEWFVMEWELLYTVFKDSPKFWN